MNYENYRTISGKEDYFNSWEPKSLKNLTEQLKNTIYKKYLLKCAVFQRDNFECQNELCTTIESPLTMHHVKWKKNGGTDIERNCVTLCYSCHKAFHRGKRVLTFKTNGSLPKHFSGKTFSINKYSAIDWKKIKKEMKVLRKNFREEHHLSLTKEQITFLLSWLESVLDYDSWD